MEIDIKDKKFQEEMGFSSEEEYQKFLDGTDDKPKEQIPFKADAAEKRFVLLRSDGQDIQVVKIFRKEEAAREAAEWLVKELTEEKPVEDIRILIREGELG